MECGGGDCLPDGLTAGIDPQIKLPFHPDVSSHNEQVYKPPAMLTARFPEAG